MTDTSLDEFLGGYQPPRTTVQITGRGDLLAKFSDLQRAHSIALRDDMAQNRDALAPQIRRDLDDLQTQIAESQKDFVFESLGSVAYGVLKAKHKPSAEDLAEGADFNLNTFPPALISACCVNPKMSIAQARKLCAKLSDQQFTKLWNGAIIANVGDDAAPKLVLPFAQEASNETSSTTASPEESPDQSSLAE